MGDFGEMPDGEGQEIRRRRKPAGTVPLAGTLAQGSERTGSGRGNQPHETRKGGRMPGYWRRKQEWSDDAHRRKENEVHIRHNMCVPGGSRADHARACSRRRDR